MLLENKNSRVKIKLNNLKYDILQRKHLYMMIKEMHLDQLQSKLYKKLGYKISMLCTIYKAIENKIKNIEEY